MQWSVEVLVLLDPSQYQVISLNVASLPRWRLHWICWREAGSSHAESRSHPCSNVSSTFHYFLGGGVIDSPTSAAVLPPGCPCIWGLVDQPQAEPAELRAGGGKTCVRSSKYRKERSLIYLGQRRRDLYAFSSLQLLIPSGLSCFTDVEIRGVIWPPFLRDFWP